jgi:N-acetylmuramoyl-L-alanine amidase
MVMTQNTLDIKMKDRKKPCKALLLGTSVCLTLLINGCNGENLTHVNGAFQKPWEEIAKEKMADETSHMQTKMDDKISIEKAGSEEMIAAPAPNVNTANMVVKSNKIIPVPEAPKSSGFNPKNIFGKNLRSDSDRLDRLERAVQDMRNDFNSVQPSIRRLMAIEGDIQNLITELEKLNADPSLATPPPRAKKVMNAKKTTMARSHKIPPSTAKKSFVKKTPPPVNGNASVYDVRIGEHPGKTRIVIDVNTKTGFNVDIDNNEHIMIIELPNANWATAMSRNFAKSPYISSYNVEASGNGHMAIFQLKRNARVGYKADLSGFQGSSRRLVIDVTN